MCFPGKARGNLLRESSNPEFGTTLARRLNQSYVFAVLLLSLIAI